MDLQIFTVLLHEFRSSNTLDRRIGILIISNKLVSSLHRLLPTIKFCLHFCMPRKGLQDNLQDNKKQKPKERQDMERSDIGCTIDLWESKEDHVLFNPSLLTSINQEDLTTYQTHGISHLSPGPSLTVRPLEITDFDKQYCELLSQLTRVGSIDKARFEAQFRSVKKCPGVQYIVVIEDNQCDCIIATASLIVERKFIHSVTLRGRIEDVVVHKDYRGKHLASLLVELMNHLGKSLGCYKLSLDCKPHLTGFYSKFGYNQETALYMVQRFFD